MKIKFRVIITIFSEQINSSFLIDMFNNNNNKIYKTDEKKTEPQLASLRRDRPGSFFFSQLNLNKTRFLT